MGLDTITSHGVEPVTNLSGTVVVIRVSLSTVNIDCISQTVTEMVPVNPLPTIANSVALLPSVGLIDATLGRNEN